MAQYVHPDFFYIFRHNVGASLKEGPSSGGQGEADGSAWAGSELDKLPEFKIIVFRFASGYNQMDDVVANFVISLDFVYWLSCLFNVFDRRNSRSFHIWVGWSNAVEDGPVVGVCRGAVF